MGEIEGLRARVADLEQRLEAERAQVVGLTNRLTIAEQGVDEAQKAAWSACRAWVTSCLDKWPWTSPPADALGARLHALAELEARCRLDPRWAVGKGWPTGWSLTRFPAPLRQISIRTEYGEKQTVAQRVLELVLEPSPGFEELVRRIAWMIAGPSDAVVSEVAR